MKWATAGDVYILIVPELLIVPESITRQFSSGLSYYDCAVMRLEPALNDMGQRVGWHIFEPSSMVIGEAAHEKKRVTDTPIIMLHEAKAVAEAWWRMR